jgi:HK97 family phage major capsid protein
MGEPINQEKFQQTILDGMTAVQDKLKKFDEFQTATKTAIGELGGMRDEIVRMKDAVNAIDILAKQIQKAHALVVSENRRSLDLNQRVTPEIADYVIGCFRKARGMDLSPAQKTVIGGSDSGIGAAVIPQDTANIIYDLLLQYGQWSTLGVVPIGSRTQVMPYITARPTAYWLSQGAQITEGAVTGSSNTVTIKDCCAWIPVANSLLEDTADAGQDFASWLLRQLAQAIAYRIDWAAFAADGTDDTTDGAYTGIAVGGTAATAANGNTTVATLDYDDFVKCLYTVAADVLNRGPRWWIHPTILAKILLVKDTSGRPVFQPSTAAPSLGGLGSILGFPVIPTGAMPSTDSANKVVAVFGEPQGCLVGVRRGLNLAASTEFQWDYNRTAYRAVQRAGIQVQIATAFAMLTTAAA